MAPAFGITLEKHRRIPQHLILGEGMGSNLKGVLPKAGLNFRFGNRFVGRISVMKVAR